MIQKEKFINLELMKMFPLLTKLKIWVFNEKTLYPTTKFCKNVFIHNIKQTISSFVKNELHTGLTVQEDKYL